MEGELERWAEAVATGDRGAFDALVRGTERGLFRVAARLVGDYDEAADVLQDAYLRAYRALASGEFDGRARVSTWLYRIVTNGALDAVRARRRRRLEPLDGAPEPARDGAGDLAARAALRELGALLADLPDEQRACVVLKELEGLSSAEVARVLGVSEGAVEQRLVRARATLKKRTADV